MSSRKETGPSARRRGIYLLPNLLTSAALFAGFYAIIASIDQSFVRSAVAIFVAMLLDGLDGRLARITGTESAFGKEYDSLSDMVAFGLAPAVLVYQWGIAQLVELGWIWGKLGWLAAFLYAVATALRLARFNSRVATSDKRFFEGLPCPSAAATVAGMVWLGIESGWSGVFLIGSAFAVTAAAGALMVSRLAYYSFKEISAGGRIPFTYVLVIPLSFVLIALNPPLVLFAMASCYSLSGISLAAWRRLRRQRERRRRLPDPDQEPR